MTELNLPNRNLTDLFHSLFIRIVIQGAHLAGIVKNSSLA